MLIELFESKHPHFQSEYHISVPNKYKIEGF